MPHQAERNLYGIGYLVLLYGFVKKTQRTPKADLELAKKRAKEIAS